MADGSALKLRSRAGMLVTVAVATEVVMVGAGGEAQGEGAQGEEAEIADTKPFLLMIKM